MTLILTRGRRRTVFAFLGAALLGPTLLCNRVFAQAQTGPITITLAGQSMIRSDVRETAPAAVNAIKALLAGDVVFTNFEAAVAEKGETVHEGMGFLTPPSTLDALTAFGFNLFAFSSNHSFDLKAAGIENTIREADSRKLVHAGTGKNLAEAAAPAYLLTAKGTIALVSSASGLLEQGARATAERPGVNELRVETGGKPNEGTAEFPATPGNTPNEEDARRILASIREARQHEFFVDNDIGTHVYALRNLYAL